MSETMAAAAPVPPNPGGPKSDLAVRTVSGIAMIAIALGALWAGGWPFRLFVILIAALMMWEWAGLVRVAGWRRIVGVGAALLVAVCAGHIAAVPEFWLSGAADALRPVLLLVAGAAVLLAVLTIRPSLGFGLLYVALPALALIYLREQQGLLVTLWAMALVWATDIGAYFAGRTFGGMKLAPRISPAKTWAGLIGGVIAAEVLSLILSTAFGLSWAWAYFATLLAISAQIGDLFESWLKRRAGVKDSGRLLPGHGGVLDRLDGLVPVAVIVAGLAIWGVS